LQSQLLIVKAIHEKDLREGFGETSLPYALEKKYHSASKEWLWQYIFPASVRSIDPVSKREKRHHLDPGVLQKAVRKAAQLAKIDKPVSPPHLPPLLRHPPPHKMVEFILSEVEGTSERFKNSSDTRLALSMSKGRQNHHDLYLYPEHSRRARSPTRSQRSKIPPRHLIPS
jgi:hypothetical protein